MTSVASIFWTGWKWSLEEQVVDTNNKNERAKKRPPKRIDYKPNDLPRKSKKDREGLEIEKIAPMKNFPYQIRWIGCPFIDAALSEISLMLEA